MLSDIIPKSVTKVITYICFAESGSSSSSKRPRLEQIPAANLDADDPIDDDVGISDFFRQNTGSL